MGECFKKEGIVYQSEIKSDEKKNMCVAFGYMKAMVNPAKEIREADRNGRQMEDQR